MEGMLGVKDIQELISQLLAEIEFSFDDYFDKDSFDELYYNGKTFMQVSVYATLTGYQEHYLEVLKVDKVDEFKEKAELINSRISEFIEAYASDTTKVPSYEKHTFLYFRRVPDDFGISYDIYERNKEKEDEEERQAMCANDEEYTPSATHGDYSPSCPWRAPGMSISDFI